MKRCGKPLTAKEYNDFRRRFLAESKEKIRERKGYFKEDHVNI